MLQIRPSEARGHAQHGWLDSHHSFSFAHYHDPLHMGFGPLRVINEDRVMGGQGFGTHGHRDMEIISYVLSGALEHQDSMGTGSVLHYGDVQRMSAGTGVRHSEFNHSAQEPVHFLQIWIEPERTGNAPGYEEKHIPVESKQGRLRLIASPDGRDDSLRIGQNASIYATIMAPGDQLQHALAAERLAYVHVVRGTVSVNGVPLKAGDAAKLSAESAVTLSDADAAEVLLFDLPQ